MVLGLMAVVLACLCCSRIDNPFCKYCSENYSPMHP